MGHNTKVPETIDVVVTTRAELAEAAAYARSKIGALGRYTTRPVPHARVRLTKHRDPAVQRAVIAQANLDVDGVPVRAQVQAETARAAIDLLAARLRRRLQRCNEHWESLRGGQIGQVPREWQHEPEPTHRPRHYVREPDERRILRRKSFTMSPCNVDEAADEMRLLDYDFHLFTERGTGSAAVIYRAGETGYRLALVAPELVSLVSAHSVPVTISEQPVPCLTEQAATYRLALLGLPFLFFIDADQGRVSVLYHRHDGHYGMITPAGP